MKLRLFCVLYAILLILCQTPQSVHALDETTTNVITQNTLSTLYNESVTDTYPITTISDTVIPIDITTQGEVNITITYPVIPNDYICKVYTDDSYISMIHSCLLSTSASSFNLSITAGGPETLYLYFTSTKKTAEELINYFTVTASLTKAETKSTTSKKVLKNNTWTKKKMANAKTKQYYKLVITGNQYFHINSNNANIKVQLLDSKKKTALSGTTQLKSSNNYQASFALGKGTYYVLVTADRTTSYQLCLKTTKVKKTYGDTLKQSTKLQLGKQYINMIKANAPVENAQYYKFKLTSDAKIQIAFYVENSSDYFQLQIYDGNKEPLPTNNYKMSNAGLLYINSRTPMPADTYYLKVNKLKKTSSGCYSLVVRKQS